MVSSITFSDNSNFLVTICNDMCRLWRVMGNLMGGLCTIPANLDAEHKEDSVKPLAITDNKCQLVCLYRGKLMFQIYEIRE